MISVANTTGSRSTHKFTPPVVLSRFAAAAKLVDGEIALLSQLSQKAYAVSAGSSSCEIGRAPFFILTGWLCRSRTDENGNRAIFEFLLPGDLVWPCAPHCSGLDLMVEVLADAILAPAASIIDACKMQGSSFPSLNNGLVMYADLARKHLLSQVSRLIQMNAPTRLYALILELHVRLTHVGLSLDNSFVCPLSQSVFADASGLSNVHINRSFGALTRAGLITRTRSLMIINAKATRHRTSSALEDAAPGNNPMLREAA